MNTVVEDSTNEAVENAAKNDPNSEQDYIDLGMAYFETHRFDIRNADAAMAAFRRALEINPQSAPGYNGVGRVYYHIGPLEKAIESYQRAIERDRHFTAAYFGLGILYLSKLGDYDSALKAFQDGLANNPNEAFLVTSMGITYARMARFGDALASFDEALELQPDNAWALGMQTIVYLYLKRYDDAIATCQRQIAVEDGNDVRRVLGYAYTGLGRDGEALAELERAVALEGDDYEAKGALAAVYRRVGREQDANQQFILALELAAQDDEYGQACLQAVSGHVEEALALVEVALIAGRSSQDGCALTPNSTAWSAIHDLRRWLLVRNSQ